MKHVLYILLVIVCSSNSSIAQTMLSGIIKNNSKELMANAAVYNKTQNTGTYTDKNGKYIIPAYKGDTIQYTYIGYTTFIFVVVEVPAAFEKNVTLTKKSNILKGVVISTFTQYQKDSLARVRLYDDALDYKQETSLKSPVSSIYQQFSKKYKDLRKFQEQFKDIEQQKFIDTKYTYELVNTQTKLDGEAVALFMNSYPMEYDFARNASELELKMWVRTQYKKYMANKEKLK